MLATNERVATALHFYSGGCHDAPQGPGFIYSDLALLMDRAHNTGKLVLNLGYVLPLKS